MNIKEKIAKIKKENPHFVKSSLYSIEGYDSVEKFINDAKHILNENKKNLNMDATNKTIDIG